jgi:hypothetical protein
LVQALPENIRLGWKGLPGTNALAYYEKLSLMAVKSFITLATARHRLAHLNFFSLKFFFTHLRNKLECLSLSDNTHPPSLTLIDSLTIITSLTIMAS